MSNQTRERSNFVDAASFGNARGKHRRAFDDRHWPDAVLVTYADNLSEQP